MADFNIELKEDEIQHMSVTNKLNTLLKISYANHKLLEEHGNTIVEYSKIIFGNGCPETGLCFKVAEHEKVLNRHDSIFKWMVGLFTAGIVAAMTAAFNVFGHYKK